MAKYQQRAHVVDAWRFDGKTIPAEARLHHRLVLRRGKLHITQPSGDVLLVDEGDYLVKGQGGHMYVYKEDVFNMNFEKI